MSRTRFTCEFHLSLSLPNMISLSLSLSQPLARIGRVLVKEGVLKKVCRKGTKDRYFFLFNDLLLYGLRLPTGSYTCHAASPIENVSITDVADTASTRLSTFFFSLLLLLLLLLSSALHPSRTFFAFATPLTRLASLQPNSTPSKSSRRQSRSLWWPKTPTTSPPG